MGEYLVRGPHRKDGQVLGWIDLSELYPSHQRDKEAVMNGIAHDPESGHFYLTGKNWPKLFKLELEP
jgi:glutamine cyclotransferase